MMLKFVLCFLMFVCNATAPAEGSINMGDVSEFWEGIIKNGVRLFTRIDKDLPHMPCTEGVDVTSGFTKDGSNEEVEALFTVTSNSSKCRNRDNIEKDEYCVLRVFRGLTTESKFLDVQRWDLNSDGQIAETSSEVE